MIKFVTKMSILVLETKGQKMKKASFTNIVECLYFIRNQFNLKYYRKKKTFSGSEALP